MSFVERKRVLWFGTGDTKPLTERLSKLGDGFQLSVVSDERSLLEQIDPSRAVVFEFDGNLPMLIGRVRRTKDDLLSNGILIGLVDGTTNQATFEVAAREAGLVIGEDHRQYGPQSSIFTSFQIFRKDFCLAAHKIIIWEPGPPRNGSLKIIGNVSAVHKTLLIRAFGDFRAINVLKLTGGASEADVYRVTPFAHPEKKGRIGASQTPFLAKIHDTNRIAQENDHYDKFVRDTVSFNNRPNLNRFRTVYTHKTSLLVEDFVERCRPIGAVLETSHPAVLIASVFDGALRNWRRHSQIKELPIAEELIFEKILKRRTPTFLAAGEYAKTKLKAPYDGGELLDRCKAFGSIRCTYNRIHGDLHAGNLYVAATSSDVVLIDFYTTGEGPGVTDPACFEVDIVFKRATKLSEKVKRELYKAPMGIPVLHANVPHDSLWVLEAVRAIRRIAISELDRCAYTFAVSCYLIQYASFEDNGTARSRGFAAYVASKLIKFLFESRVGR